MPVRIALLPLALLPLLAIGAAPPPEERRVMLTGFDRIRIDGPFRVQVVSDRPAAATLSGERRAIEGVSVRNVGNTLVIGASTATFDGWRDKSGGATITIATRSLRAASVNGGGSLDIDQMRGQRIELTLNGGGALSVGTVTADHLATTLTGTGAVRIAGGTARNARFLTYGAGSIDASGMVASDLTVHAQSAGEGNFTARYTANITALGAGSVQVAGDAACRISGPGPVRCEGKASQR